MPLCVFVRVFVTLWVVYIVMRKETLSFANCGATSLHTTAIDLTKWLDNYRTGE